ncbi:MAG: hypothetical protein J1F17_07180 [Oscillospiraceae bacterium]|nr:hypothetical protein [Oscillospiraceae bacterium]
MGTTRNKLTFENLVSIYFRNLHKIIFANLLFMTPVLGIGTLLYFLTKPLGYIATVFLTMLTVVICFPLYAGVNKVTRNLAREEDVKVFSAFTEAVVSNYKQFLIHSIFLYFILTIGIFSFRFYTYMASEIGGIMYVLLVSVIAIAVWLLFTFFYIPIMTVTFDLSIKNIYKNSALMAIGEIKLNAVSLFSIFILTAICGTPVFFSGSHVWLLIAITFGMLLLIYPVSANFISNFFVQSNMMMMLTGRADEAHDIKSMEEKLQKLRNETKDELEGIDIEKVKKSKEDYIFHNGKMMKKELLLEMLEEREGKDE